MVIESITLNKVSLRLSGNLILNNVNLSLEPGIHCLLGPNGSGKTMTNRLICLLEDVSSGTIHWNETLVNPIAENKKLDFIRRIGYMSQEPVFMNKTVRENIASPLVFRSWENINETVDEIVAEFDLVQVADSHISKLSTGQRQKVALARTLVYDPECIILDEPTSALDMNTTKWLEEYIINIQEINPRIVIWTTHDKDQVKRLADTLSILLEGKLLVTGNSRDILFNPPNVAVAKYLDGQLIQLSDFDL